MFPTSPLSSFTLSPTLYVRSTISEMPDIRSLRLSWSARPMARPAMPSPARNGVTSMPHTASMEIIAATMISALMAFWISGRMVSLYCERVFCSHDMPHLMTTRSTDLISTYAKSAIIEDERMSFMPTASDPSISSATMVALRPMMVINTISGRSVASISMSSFCVLVLAHNRLSTVEYMRVMTSARTKNATIIASANM